MTLHVYLQEDLMGRGLTATIVNRNENLPRPLIMRLSDVGVIWEPYDADDLTVQPEPTFRMPSEAGRALLDALTRHYHGAEDTRQLRHDYERERARVDQQAKVLADVARTLAGKAAES